MSLPLQVFGLSYHFQYPVQAALSLASDSLFRQYLFQTRCFTFDARIILLFVLVESRILGNEQASLGSQAESKALRLSINLIANKLVASDYSETQLCLGSL